MTTEMEHNDSRGPRDESRGAALAGVSIGERLARGMHRESDRAAARDLRFIVKDVPVVDRVEALDEWASECVGDVTDGLTAEATAAFVAAFEGAPCLGATAVSDFPRRVIQLEKLRSGLHVRLDHDLRAVALEEDE